MLDDGSITIDCPVGKIPEKGYFTLFDGSQAATGASPPLSYHIQCFCYVCIVICISLYR